MSSNHTTQSPVVREEAQEPPVFTPQPLFTAECDCEDACHPHVKCKSLVTGPDGLCDTCRGKHEKPVHYWSTPEKPNEEEEPPRKNVAQTLGM